MFILKAFVNNDQVGEIHIQNTMKQDEMGKYIYKIVKPEGFEGLEVSSFYPDSRWENLAYEATRMMRAKGLLELVKNLAKKPEAGS